MSLGFGWKGVSPKRTASTDQVLGDDVGLGPDEVDVAPSPMSADTSLQAPAAKPPTNATSIIGSHDADRNDSSVHDAVAVIIESVAGNVDSNCLTVSECWTSSRTLVDVLLTLSVASA